MYVDARLYNQIVRQESLQSNDTWSDMQIERIQLQEFGGNSFGGSCSTLSSIITSDTNTSSPDEDPEDESETDDFSSSTSSSQTKVHFKAKIDGLIGQRLALFDKVEDIKRKKYILVSRNKFVASSHYCDEVAKCHAELAKLSDQIKHEFIEYSRDHDSIDLHGLIMNEVREIVPEVAKIKCAKLYRMQSSTANLSVFSRKIRFHIITGKGQSYRHQYGPIYRYVVGFLKKNNIG